MNTGIIFKTAFALTLVCVVVGAYLKILHAGGADVLLAIAIIAPLIFIATGIYEVQTSKIKTSEKVIWTIGFLFMGSIAAIVYLAAGRRHVLASKKSHTTDQ